MYLRSETESSSVLVLCITLEFDTRDNHLCVHPYSVPLPKFLRYAHWAVSLIYLLRLSNLCLIRRPLSLYPPTSSENGLILSVEAQRAVSLA